ncbi:MAG: DUF5076 domain-containing protein [Kofleriaceae bacterium]
MPHELPVPPPVRADRNAREIVRVWASDQAPQTFVLDPAAYDDPAAWGLLLVDLARQVAAAMAGHRNMDRREILSRIRAGFDAEWDAPADAIG